MKQFKILIVIGLLSSGCTQVVTAPVSLATTAVSTTIDVAGATGGAIVDLATDDEEAND